MKQQSSALKIESESHTVERIPMDQQKVYWGIHYTKNKDGKYVGERLGVGCKRTMKSLVEKWNHQVDSYGKFMGEIVGNKYPEIPDYEVVK